MAAVMYSQPYRAGPMLYHADEIVISVVRKQITDAFGSCPMFAKARAIGVVRNNCIVAGCVYHDYRSEEQHLEMSIGATSPVWATRQVIGALLAYPFRDLNCRRVTAVVRSDNERALRFDRGIGFRDEGCIREYFAPGVDGMILGMLREEWLASPWSTDDGRKIRH